MCGMRIENTKPFMPPFEEYIKEIESVWESAWLTNMGRKHQELTELLCDFLSVSAVSLFANGHLALECAIKALDIKGEVITTPFTFVSTTHAIVRNGLIPVFCDINPSDCTIDTFMLESLINDRTSAILPVHVYGNVCDVNAINAIAKKYGLKVLYDAAHAFGAKIGGKSVACYGDAVMFSFHATKVFHTIEGGAVACPDENVSRILDQMKNFGFATQDFVARIGLNAKMNELEAAMGICNLRHFKSQVHQREELSARYIEKLSGMNGLSFLQRQRDSDFSPNYSYFPILINQTEFGCSRDELHERLRQRGVSARKYFWPLTSRLECYELSLNPAETPNAAYAAANVLTLPLYGTLGRDSVDQICEIIKEEQLK